MIKTYSQLILFPTFEERFEYLKLSGQVGIDTFGFDRIFNQKFYTSKEWRRIRDFVIARDNGCDLGHPDHIIQGSRIIIHHLNPISLEDISNSTKYLLDPEYLITTIHDTHNAIHYGDKDLLQKDFITERSKYDTCPWRK